VPEEKSLSGRSSSQIKLLTGLLIVLCGIVLAVYWPVLSCGALFFDDNQYLTENPLVQNPSWSSAQRFLTEILEPSTVQGYYQPLTMLSLMADYALGGRGDNLRQFHRTSLALHIINTALVVILLYLLFGRVWPAAAAGLLFGLHPMTLETIAWVGERKTLLAAFFCLMSLLLYVCYVRKGARKFYIAALLMYVPALMSKPTSTPLPLLMLLMDYWPLRRLRRQVLPEKVPFFVIGIISAVITYVSQGRAAVVTSPLAYSPGRILLVLCHNIIFYLCKIFWPTNLSPYYAFPKPLGLSDPMVLAGVVGSCILICLLLVSLRQTAAALTGWLFFFVAIFPTMGVVGFTIVIASDKYAYLPSLGLLMILTSFLGWFGGRDFMKGSVKGLLVVVTAVVVLAGAEAAALRRYAGRWSDTVGLCRYILALSPDAGPVHTLLGVELKLAGDFDGAVSHYRRVLEINPASYRAAHNLAIALEAQGKTDEAIGYYRKALRGNCQYVRAHNNLGSLLKSQGKLEEAKSHFVRALQLEPDHLNALNNLGNVLALQGRFDQAAYYYNRALQINPDYARAHYNLATALKQNRRYDEAVGHYRRALQLGLDGAELHCNLGIALQLQGRDTEALINYREALRLKPDYAEAHNNIASVLIVSGELDDALVHFREAVRLRPDYVTSLNGMAQILATHPNEAVRDADKAIELGLRAAKLTAYRNTDVLETLSEAYAAAGRFDKAVETAKEALDLATASGDNELAERVRGRLRDYQQKVSDGEKKPNIKMQKDFDF